MVRVLLPDSYSVQLLFREPDLVPTYRNVAPRYFLALVKASDVLLLDVCRRATVGDENEILRALAAPYGE